jgi:hypothetical protein
VSVIYENFTKLFSARMLYVGLAAVTFNYCMTKAFFIYLSNISCLGWEEQYFNTVWPNWKDGIHNDMTENINDIGKHKLETYKCGRYYACSCGPIAKITIIGRLPRPDIVHFRSACRGTEIFLRELTLLNMLSSNPKSSRSVDLAFSYKLLFYLH